MCPKLRLLFSVVTMAATCFRVPAAAAADGSYQSATKSQEAAGIERTRKLSEAAPDVTGDASNGKPPLPAGIRPTLPLAFTSPEAMTVNWDIARPGAFDSEPLIVPGRYAFPQGTICRFKLSNIPGHPDLEVYPTVEIANLTPRTETIAMQVAVAVRLTQEDFDQVQSGIFVTKVVYLPDPEFQNQAETIRYATMVGTKLAPNVDPIIEADRRGSILAIIRIGNQDFVPSSDRGAECSNSN